MADLFSIPVIAITLYSILIVIVINFFYRILIKQNEAKMVKARIKELRQESKAAQKEGNTEKSTKIMKEMLGENSKIMKMTMKPMLVSFIIVIFFLPFLGNVYGDIAVPVNNGQGNFTLDGQLHTVSLTGSNISIDGNSCTLPCEQQFGGYRWEISSENNNVKLARVVVSLPVSLPFFGDAIGWLGWYIIVSIPLVIIIRRLFKINV